MGSTHLPPTFDPREEPGALAAHAGICAGGEEQSSSLPRPSAPKPDAPEGHLHLHLDSGLPQGPDDPPPSGWKVRQTARLWCLLAAIMAAPAPPGRRECST